MRIPDFIGPGIGVIAEVRHADDQMTLLFFAEQAHHVTRHPHRVEILHALKILRGYQVIRTDAHAKQSDAHITEGTDRIGLDACFQRCPAHVVVSRYKIELRELHRGSQRFDAIIKIVIAQRHHVIANQRHRFVFDFALEKIEIGRALKYIAGINHQRVGIFLAHAFNQRRAPRHAALAAVCFVAGVDRIDLRMRIIRVQDCYESFAGRNLKQRISQRRPGLRRNKT